MEKKTIDDVDISDDLSVMLDLCTNALVHYSSIIKAEHASLGKTEYGEALFFEFEDYFNSLTGIASTIVQNKRLSPAQISFLKELDLKNKPGVEAFLKDRENWACQPGTASELILWKYLILLIKEWLREK